MQEITPKNEVRCRERVKISERKRNVWNCTWEFPAGVCLGEGVGLGGSTAVWVSECRSPMQIPPSLYCLQRIAFFTHWWFGFCVIFTPFTRTKQKADRIAFVLITYYQIYFNLQWFSSDFGSCVRRKVNVISAPDHSYLKRRYGNPGGGVEGEGRGLKM